MDQHRDDHTHDHQHDHQHDDHHHSQGLADLLDLDAEVFTEQTAAVHRDIERLADAPVRTILDLGAGTGVGTFGLLQHFPDARAVAVDASAEMLEHLLVRAGHLGLSGRITTEQADLDQAVPSVDPVDLAWASASLHHLADPDATLTQLATRVRPGGLLAVLEMSAFPRFVPDEAPGGAAEARVHELMAAARAIDLPTMGSDWAQRLTRTGWSVEEDRAIVLEPAASVSPVIGRYAAASLTRLRDAMGDRLGADDRAALGALVDGGPTDVRRRDDIHVRGERRLLIARRSREDV